MAPGAPGLRFSRILITLAVLASALPATIAAQTNPPLVELPEYAINASGHSRDNQSELRALADIPGGTGFIDLAGLRGGRLGTPADLFQMQPGVLVMTAFGGIDHPRLSIRGASIQRGGDPSAGRGILFLQDGFPLNFSDGSFDFVEFLDPSAPDHATIARGGNALTFGATTLGGAVNLVSPTGRAAPGGTLRAEAGGHGYFRSQLSYGATSGNQDIHVTASVFSLEGWRDYNHQEAERVLFNHGVAFAGGWENRVWFSAMRSRVEITGVQTLAAIAARDKSPLALAPVAQLGRDTSQYRLGDRLTRRFSGAGELSIGAHIAYVDYDFTQGGNITRAENTDAGVYAAWTLRGKIFSRPNTLSLGLRAQAGRRDQRVFLNGDGVPPHLGGVAGALHSDNRLTAKNATLWIDEQIAPWRGFTLIASLSAARASRDNDDRYAPVRAARPDSSASESSSALMPRLGVRCERRGFQWFANVTRSHEPPTWDALLTTIPGAGSGQTLIDGPNPRRAAATSHAAQHAITAETGARGHALRGRLAYDITVYRSWVGDELLLLATDAPGVATRFGNAGRTIHQGAEAGASFEFLARRNAAARIAGPASAPPHSGGHSLVLRVSHTWSDFFFDGDPVWRDNALPVIPPHFLQAALDWRHPRGWHGGAMLTWQPRGGWADYANTLRAPGYALVSLNFGYTPPAGKGLGAFLDLRNALDRRHVTGMSAGAGNLRGRDEARFFAGEPVSLYGGAEWKW